MVEHKAVTDCQTFLKFFRRKQWACSWAPESLNNELVVGVELCSSEYFGSSLCRYVLVTVGPVFTEEMWRLACCALQDAFSATLEPVKVHKHTFIHTQLHANNKWCIELCADNTYRIWKHSLTHSTGPFAGVNHIIHPQSEAGVWDRSNLKAFAVNTVNMLTVHVKLDNPS